MSLKSKIITKYTVNRTPGRYGRRVLAVVCHITAGRMPGCLSWMCNPAAKASAHYLVTRTGDIYLLVAEENSAWHVGFVNKPSWSLYDGTNPNYYTVGVEFEALAGEGLTEPQYLSGAQLIAYLMNKYELPLDTMHLIGHYRIDGVNRPNDPGKEFPWSRLFRDLRNGVLDMALEVWMIEGGRAALAYLEKRGMVLNAADWGKEEKLGAPTPQYLMWMMMQRLAERLEGK